MKMLRSEICDLGWSQPRTAVLAKRFGFSDVALVKRCVKANIPMPPRGYWAKRQSKKLVALTALPQRLPGAEGVISFERNDFYRARAVDAEEGVQPPVFREPAETFVAAAVARMGRVRAIADLSAPPPGLAQQRNFPRNAQGYSKSKPGC